MSGPVVHVGAGVTCLHGGPVTVVSANARVLVAGQPAATLADNFLVAGCSFAPGTPHPCVRLQWTTTAARVLVNGQPVITQASVGLGLAADQAPQGPPVVALVQPRVVAM